MAYNNRLSNIQDKKKIKTNDKTHNLISINKITMQNDQF